MVRVLSSVVMGVILLLVLYILPPFFAVLAVSIAIYLAVLELLGAISNEIIKKYEKLIALFGASIPYTLYAPAFSLITVLFSAVFIVFLYLKNHEKLEIKEISFVILAGIILPQMLCTLARIFFLENGKFLILMPMISAWCSDIFAYFFGRAIGKRKLAPSISPNKTIEGSFGGIFGAVAGMLVFGLITQNFIGIPVIFLILIGVFGSVCGQIGDLFFSMIKRQCDMKDYSNFIPGHGGILDRFDSVIFTAPLAYAILMLF